MSVQSQEIRHLYVAYNGVKNIKKNRNVNRRKALLSL